MATIVTRSGKGSPLTHTEMDSNFTNLNDGKAGYTASGEGGDAIPQATSKATAVSLNKKCGRITMNNAQLAANTSVSFDLTNSTIAEHDVLVINHKAEGIGNYVFNAVCASGSASITVTNITSSAHSEAIVLSFALIEARID